MYCSSCGNKMENNERFCGHCGNAIYRGTPGFTPNCGTDFAVYGNAAGFGRYLEISNLRRKATLSIINAIIGFFGGGFFFLIIAIYFAKEVLNADPYNTTASKALKLAKAGIIVHIVILFLILVYDTFH